MPLTCQIVDIVQSDRPAYPPTDQAFEKDFEHPMLDLGVLNDGWRGGGAMWFTHTQPMT